MRDRKKFYRPKVTKSPKVGDVYVKLIYGEIVPVKANDYEKIKNFFEIDSMEGETSETPGNLKVIHKKLNYNTVIEPESYDKKLFELKEIVGDKNDNFSIGDIKLYNNILNRNIIMTFEDWLEVGDSWNITGIYGVTTYSEEESEDGDYVIMSHGTTFIIKPSDYPNVENHWEHVDTILKNTEE